MQTKHTEFLQLFNQEVQYVVPRWQRRYCWNEADIERLVNDLLTIAEAGSPGAAHYGGALLTFPESTPAGDVPRHRVVDGQQRLTTVSILLACIAENMGSGPISGWTEERLRDRLTNHRSRPLEKQRKLRLQQGDEGEYRRGLEGRPSGPGAVTQAWRIARRLVAQCDVARLLTGIGRFKVVSIALDATDDPQQIFESLNATGRPLTESEKVKNWLLMGLKDGEQQHLHDNHWIEIERGLGVERSTEPVDLFLRDFLRWKIGQNLGIARVHEEFRRWAVREDKDQDRPALCRELSRLARLYGILTGTAGGHPNARVERALRHLRAMGINAHRPFTLRLLYDTDRQVHPRRAINDALATSVEGVGAWITRLWLANRSIAGLNTAATELANRPAPHSDEDYAGHWLARIRRLRNTHVGAPGDDEVREGVRNRKAYGGSATKSSFAVLCALMEEEHDSQAPARDKLTIEHIMPRKLTKDWKRDLGDNAEDLHEQWHDRLANLTLSGDIVNSSMGANTFSAKRKVYKESTMGLTRRVANETAWNKAALERRAAELADRALKRWPWKDLRATSTQPDAVPLKWRIGNEPWQEETVASQMVLNVAGALLDLDAANAAKLSGDAVSSNLHPTTRYLPDTKVGALTLRAVPGHHQYVLYPYRGTFRESADYCRALGERCGVKVEVELEVKENQARAFWTFLRESVGSILGQKSTWRSPGQWTDPINSHGDKIGIYVGNPERLWLYVRAGEYKESETRALRMRKYSQMILEHMADQETDVDAEQEGKLGRSITVVRRWVRDDENEWLEAAQWIKDQHDRLLAIIKREGGSFTSAED